MRCVPRFLASAYLLQGGRYVQHLLDAALIECLAVLGGILQMLGVGTCKIVGTTEVLLGTHIEVVVMYVVEHCIDASHGGDAYRTGREADVAVSVVGTADKGLVGIDSFQAKLLKGKLDGRVSL